MTYRHIYYPQSVEAKTIVLSSLGTFQFVDLLECTWHSGSDLRPVCKLLLPCFPKYFTTGTQNIYQIAGLQHISELTQ